MKYLLSLILLMALTACSTSPTCQREITITAVDCSENSNACRLRFSDDSDDFFIPKALNENLLGTTICMDPRPESPRGRPQNL